MIHRIHISGMYILQKFTSRLHGYRRFIGKIEVAFSKPSLDTLIDIAEALKTDLSEFVKN